MAWYGASNQLIEIDTGKTRTSVYNPAQSGNPLYAGIGQGQILGQRYVGSAKTTSNPNGSPSIFLLVQYLKTSATTTGNLQTAPAPLYWTDTTYTTVSGISTESGFGLNGIAGYMMTNLTDYPALTAAILLGAQIFMQVAGNIASVIAPTTNQVSGNWIVPVAGTFVSAGVTAGTAPGYRALGVQTSATASGLCNALVTADIF